MRTPGDLLRILTETRNLLGVWISNSSPIEPGTGASARRQTRGVRIKQIHTLIISGFFEIFAKKRANLDHGKMRDSKK